MNVLQIINGYYPELKFGGPPVKVHALSLGLHARGHNVHVVTFHSEKPHNRHVENLEGIPVQYLPWLGWGLRQWPTKSNLLKAAIQQTEIVHCYGLYNALCPLAVRIAHKLKRPCVIEPLGMFQPRARNRLVKRLYHYFVTYRMFRHAACVVATSQAEFEELKQAVGATRLVMRRNGIDVNHFQSLPSSGEFRWKFKIPPEKRIILYLGRISPIKNLENLVRAFAKITTKDCQLILAGPMGERDYSEKLQTLIGLSQLGGKVHLTGALYGSAKLAALAAAELLVLPSLSESFGNAAAEAVAAGVPVLLTETCGIAPLIHQRAGLAVSPGVDSLAYGLSQMLDHRERRDALTRQRSDVVRELSWDEPLDQTERLYAEILSEPKYVRN